MASNVHSRSAARTTRLGLVLLVCTASVCAALAPPAGAVKLKLFRNGFPRDADPKAIVAGPDGNLWFTEPFANRIGRITPKGRIVEYRRGISPELPDEQVTGSQRVNPSILGIAAGPDGNVWFTEESRIGRITPRGQVTEFSQGLSPRSMPRDIVAGPDGNLWFTEAYYEVDNGQPVNTADRVGRITPQGQITEFPVPSGTNPSPIAAGPDGNLWIAGRQGRVVRMTPSGATTSFQLPTGSVLDISAGPDGNLWIVAQARRGSAAVVVRLTPSGAVRRFRYGVIDVVGASITAGPDGNLWVAGGSSRYANRITPRGKITSYFLPSWEFSPGSDALGSFGDITAGPDGNLWLVENEGWVLRLTPGGPPPPVRVALYSDETPVYNDGIVTAWFACSEGSGRCAGTYTLTTRRNGRKITLVRRRYSIRAETRRKAVRFKLPAAAQQMLASGPRRFSAQATARTRANRSSKRILIKYYNEPRP